MSYDAITSGETNAGQPVKESLLKKVKDNFIDHETRITANENAIANKHVDSLFNISFTCSEDTPTTNDMKIEVKQNDGSTDPTSGSPAQVSFRSSSEDSGLNQVINIESALSLTIPGGATLGTESGGDAPLDEEIVYVYAINNSGTVELAVSKSYYSPDNLVSTTAIGTGSDSSTSIYSASARSNVPVKCIGYFIEDESTAGDWTTAVDQIFVGDPKYINYSESHLLDESGDSWSDTSGTWSEIWSNDLQVNRGFIRIFIAPSRRPDDYASGEPKFQFPGTGSGMLRLKVDGTTVRECDFGSDSNVLLNIDFGVIPLSRGNHTISVEGKTETSPNLFYIFRMSLYTYEI